MIWTHDLSSVALSLGPVDIRWYGVMYAVSFLLGYWYLALRVQQGASPFTRESLETLFVYVFAGVVLGGRLGYFLLYSPETFFSDPLMVLQIWQGGMSFHGGLTGVLLAVGLFARRFRLAYLQVTDEIVVPVAVGLMLGRVGNFINGELPGRVTDGSWGVIFPGYGSVPRHPAQLYAAVKDLTLTLLLLPLRGSNVRGMPSFMFLFLYGLFRFAVEGLWREPLDGYIGVFTRGQLYSLPLMTAGLLGILYLTLVQYRSYRNQHGKHHH